MKKPKKKKYTKANCIEDRFYGRGYNHAIDKYEAYFKHLLGKIPSGKRIKESPSSTYAQAYYQGEFDVLMDLSGEAKRIGVK